MTQSRSRKDAYRRSLLVLAAVRHYWQDNLRSPSLRELVLITGINSTRTIRAYLIRLEREGRVKYNRVVARGIVPTGMKVVFE